MDGGVGRLLRVEEAAERLGLSRSFAWMLVSRGELGAVKLGRRTLVSEAELARFIEAHETAGTGRR
ncbi:MAG TPA: helix-turn-helix domain-containing protein [Candidatus Dormibacteraeota bacterium]|nr:helix-turn-helix domain-containing protein [Candidatus Dormibacteraeota bacterium]